jgi:putative transposase
VVTPAARKEAVAVLVANDLLSERRACRLVGVSRTARRHVSTRALTDKLVRERLQTLAAQYPRYGYLMLHGLLKNEGMVINCKRTWRLYTEARLQVRTKWRKKLTRPRIPMLVPLQRNERWSMDFVHDQLAGGCRFRVLNIVDDFSRECIGQLVDTPLSGQRVARYLSQLIEMRGRPQSMVCDNGTEFTCKAMYFWSQEQQVRRDFIQPGKPTQNAFAESFNGKFRDTCLNLHWFRTMYEARERIDDWRTDYNDVRPHSSLGYLPPSVFARNAA